MSIFSTARHNMVESQIRTNKVTDPILIAALSDVPRERFVPESFEGVAYVDEDIQIAPGRYLMEPMVLARLLDAAAICQGDMVLDVGCGTGYSSAVISRLANTVVALESDERIAAKAGTLMSELEIDNVAVVTGPLENGYGASAPYDVILIGGGINQVPDAILGQLGEGGRLITVIQKNEGSLLGQGTLMLKSGESVSGRPVFDAHVPSLPGFALEKGFEF